MTAYRPRRVTVWAASVAATLALPQVAFATHPLATDDAGTLGRGERQVELAIGQSRAERPSGGAAVREDATQLSATLTLGVRDDLDLSVAAGSGWAAVRTGGAVSIERRPGDLDLNVKWRAFRRGGLTLAVKPGLSVAADDPGAVGRAAWSVAVIATREIGFLALDLEGTWERDGRAGSEGLRSGRRQLSLAARARVGERLRLVADASAESRQADRAGPASVRGGAVWSVAGVDLDVGLGAGLSEAAPDLAFLGGVTWRL